MKVNDFVEQRTIKPFEDIEPNFKLTKRIDIDALNHEGCFNCNDTCNQMRLKSESWTSVQHCWKCNHLNVTYIQDRMGGIHMDVVECYTDK